MDYKISNMGQGDSHRFEAFEIVSERADHTTASSPPNDISRIGNVPLHTGGNADRTVVPTSIVVPSETKRQVSLSQLAALPLGRVSDEMAKTIAHAAFFQRRSGDVAQMLQRDFGVTDRQMQETVDPSIALGIAQRAWQTEGSFALDSTRWRSGDTRFFERVEDAFVAMLPTHWRRGEAWALSLAEDASFSPRIRASVRLLLQHFERDTLDFIKSLPDQPPGTITKFFALHSLIAQVQDQSTWFGLWHRAREMPWYVQPALMHRLAARLPCTVMSAAESTALANDFDRWQATMAAHCIAHDSGLLLSRGYAAVIEALSHLAVFNAPAKLSMLCRHVESALRQTPVHARAEVLDVLVNLDLTKLGPGSEVLTQRVPSNLCYLLWDPLAKATCPSARFAERICHLAIDMWNVLPDSGERLDQKIAALCKRFDLGAEHAMSLRSRLSGDEGTVGRHQHQRVALVPIVNSDDFDFPESTGDRMKAKL